MPRKAKEKVIENEIIDEKVTKVKSGTGTRKKAVKSDKNVDSKEKVVKESVDEIKPVKKTTRKKKTDVEVVDETAVVSSEKKAKTTAKKKTSAKKKSESATEKKTTTSTKKKSAATTTKKATSSKKKVEDSTEKKSTASTKKKSATTTKKSTTSSKKTSTTKATSTSKKKTEKTAEAEKTPVQIVEYYDLPYTYGNTMVKLLAQTPKTLFVYWEVSDLDIKNFKEQYGEDFFNITKPVLIVRNLTLNKTTEIEINDFANCWYLSTEDSDCKFDIELARKFIKDSNNTKLENSYLPIAKSNNLQAPNDHIMFEKLSNFITFTDTSTGETIKKNIKSFNFLKDLYKFYKDMYNDEILKNPSSNFNF